MVNIHEHPQPHLAGGDLDPALAQLELLPEEAPGDERVRRERHAHPAHFAQLRDLAEGVIPADVKPQVAVLLNPHVQSHLPVADGHGTRGIVAG